MKKTLVISAIALTVLATGCSLFKTTPKVEVDKKTGAVQVSEPIQTVAAIDDVLYGEWTVTNVSGTQVTGDTRPYVVFDTTSVNPFELKIYADNGCNTLNGTLGVTPGGQMRKTSDFLSTMKFCPDAPYELGINMAFETVAKYRISKVGNEYLLYMTNAAGKDIMVLRKCDIAFINGAWTVTSIAGNPVDDEKGVQLVIDTPELKVHGNTGCNVLNGNIFIDPDQKNSLQFRDLATTRMACPDMETEQSLLVALEQVETVAPGADGTTAQLKDAAGVTLITLRRLNLKQPAQPE